MGFARNLQESEVEVVESACSEVGEDNANEAQVTEEYELPGVEISLFDVGEQGTSEPGSRLRSSHTVVANMANIQRP